MENTFKYIETNKEKFLEDLFEVIRIPSISSESAHKEDMQRCAEHLSGAILKAGADRAEVFQTEGHPVVFAEKIIDPSKPTVMVYGHYDVMPVTPLELWTSQPFEPEIRDGKIYARGANDDKGQSFIHVKAFEAMCQSGELPCNVKFMIEGEEEIGSPSLEKWCAENKEMLQSDIILVSDTSMLSWETPSITCGLRGLAYMEVEVTGPSHDLHSGLYGGAVVNPISALSQMIASLTDQNGRVTLPGFYDDVLEFSAEDRASIAKAPFSIEEYKKSIDVADLAGEEGYTTLERTGIRPALDVNGIWGGHIAEGAKTIIASKAYAKISMRLVANQDSQKIAKLFEDHLQEIAPKGVTVKAKYLHGGEAYNCPTTLKAYKAAEKAVETTFGVAPVPYYSGGSITIISTFERILGTKTILLGFGLNSDAIHSPNENFKLENFFTGIDTIVEFYKEFTK